MEWEAILLLESESHLSPTELIDMPVVEEAFVEAGKKQGLEIWRIENFKPVPWDARKYGIFYTGDSYIVLKTNQFGKGYLKWDIHFWLGTETSQDESGVAAIKTIELDDMLGGEPTQYREVQGHESKLFLSYFKDGIRYLEGGIDSGFYTVGSEVVIKRLLRVKGKRHVRATQVPLTTRSMNKGDCFILDSGSFIYVWVGDKSGRFERIKAIKMANAMRDQEHAGRAKVLIIDESSTTEEQKMFFGEFNESSEEDILEWNEVESDVEHETQQQIEIALYKISDDSGQVKTNKVAERPLKQEHLNSGDSFILDVGVAGVFVWTGKMSTKLEKAMAWRLAQAYMMEFQFPPWAPLVRVVDGGEPPIFKQYFSSWTEPEAQRGLGRIFTQKQIAASGDRNDFDVESLHSEKRRLLAKNVGRAYGFNPDDGSGKVEIWRVENFELAPVDPSIHGMFFSGDSYVIKYTYNKHGERHILYYWQGFLSTIDEKAASAIWAVKLDREIGGRAVQVRVVQDSEPYHFLKIFRGKMVIFMGGHASGFRNIRDYDTYDVDGTRLFQVRGTDANNVRAVQRTEEAGSLNSDDVFVLETPTEVYLWFGKGASEEEQEMGKNTVKLISPDRQPIVIEEGDEPDDFWNALGGRGEYETELQLPEPPLLPPRLFHCSDESGKFEVEEIADFHQEDLYGDDVMILDSGDEVYVWIGKGANDEEKNNGMKLAEDYLRKDPTDRNLDNTVIFRVTQNDEPASFKALFESWNDHLWDESQD